MQLQRAASGIDLFTNLSREEITELCGWIKPLLFPANYEIFKEGQVPEGLYILTSGTVAVNKISPRGKFRLAMIDAPNYFGEMGLLDGTERCASCVTKTDVEVALLPFPLFSKKLHESNLTALRIALNVGRIVCARLRSTNTSLAVKTASVAASMSAAVRRKT